LFNAGVKMREIARQKHRGKGRLGPSALRLLMVNSTTDQDHRVTTGDNVFGDEGKQIIVFTTSGKGVHKGSPLI